MYEMKLELDVKINKNSEDKINEFSVEKFLKKHVKSSKTKQGEKDKGNIMPKISGWAILAILVMIVIVVVNFASNQSWWDLKPIGRQTNVLAVLLVVLLIITELFKKEK